CSCRNANVVGADLGRPRAEQAPPLHHDAHLHQYHDAAFRCGLFGRRVGCCEVTVFDAPGRYDPALTPPPPGPTGACAAARAGLLPRQKLTIAAAMNTLE